MIPENNYGETEMNRKPTEDTLEGRRSSR